MHGEGMDSAAGAVDGTVAGNIWDAFQAGADEPEAAPGATGGSAITEYSIVSSPATTTQTTSNTTYTFTGLTNGTDYTFTATAINANGSSVDKCSSHDTKLFKMSLPTSLAPLSVAGTSP